MAKKRAKPKQAVEAAIDNAAAATADTAAKIDEALSAATVDVSAELAQRIAAGEPDDAKASGEGVVIVRTRKAASRRRAGLEFSREPRKFAAGELTDAQIMALVDDPELRVTMEPAEAA